METVCGHGLPFKTYCALCAEQRAEKLRPAEGFRQGAFPERDRPQAFAGVHRRKTTRAYPLAHKTTSTG